jgi:hypothetical protein
VKFESMRDALSEYEGKKVAIHIVGDPSVVTGVVLFCSPELVWVRRRNPVTQSTYIAYISLAHVSMMVPMGDE